MMTAQMMTAMDAVEAAPIDTGMNCGAPSWAAYWPQLCANPENYHEDKSFLVWTINSTKEIKQIPYMFLGAVPEEM